MARTKEEKQSILEKVKTGLASPSSVFVHFKGVSVGEISEARKKLRDEGVSYFVAKKTLIKRAMADSNVSGEAPQLDGEVAIAFNADADGDPTAPARVVHNIGKELGDERFTILAGVYENAFLDKTGMTEIATIPSVPVLRGMFVNVINSPIQGLVVALGQIAEKKEA